ncbi:DNA ligase [Psychromonas antarctica]|jgi:DNA ligase-1|uniref:DNA ligase n=1 Tax=Psychromonas antarctica TaxID=67573 RepID=UPI001EE7F96D|nr:DNA ligase [Psychromonas antarctica]MCG6200900.1 DNA ligase [Psychromonas antarctica]
MPAILTLFFILLFSPLTQSATPPIQLATLYHQDIDIKAYWVSEKLDGVRAYWDGKNLISRQGNIFNAPRWFIKDFPAIPLDGELWIKRNQFAQVSGIVRQHKDDNKAWQKILFMIFDLPSSKVNFSERITSMRKIVKNNPSPYLKMIQQQQLNSNSELQLLLDKVINKGGEGLMLHLGTAYYQTKRSNNLMKLKKYQDAEAIVLKHLPGKGRNSGRLGALLVKTEAGIIFKIGSGFSDSERENPPPIGSRITYQYIGKTVNNVPRFASFMRIRESM